MAMHRAHDSGPRVWRRCRYSRSSGRPEAWLAGQEILESEDDEWKQRLAALLERGLERARELGISEEDVEADVAAASAEVKARGRWPNGSPRPGADAT